MNRTRGTSWTFIHYSPRVQISAFFLAFKGIDNIVKAQGPINMNTLFSNAIFRDIVISLLSTLGLYILASLVHVRAARMS